MQSLCQPTIFAGIVIGQVKATYDQSHHLVDLCVRHGQRWCNDHTVSHSAHDESVAKTMAAAHHTHTEFLGKKLLRSFVFDQHQSGHKSACFGVAHQWMLFQFCETTRQ